MDGLIELMDKFIEILQYFRDWFLFGRKKRGSYRSDMIIFYIVCIFGIIFFAGVIVSLFLKML